MPHKRNAKTVALVQARLGSNRLPMKSLLCLRDFPLIDWVTRRLGRSKKLDGIMIAVPDTLGDAVLLDHLRRHDVPCLAGPEDDVLTRMTLAAKASGADTVVRVCADNPLVWAEAVDRLVTHYAQTPCDYAYNHIPRNNLWPDGLGAEILSRELLEELADKARLPSQREHCLNYIWDNARAFRIATFDPQEAWLRRPEIKLDVDTAEDFRRLSLLPLHPDMEASAIMNLF